MANTKHNRPRKYKHIGYGKLTRASGVFRKSKQKHVPLQPNGYARFSQKYLNKTARKAVRAQERIELTKLKTNPDLITKSENRAFIHWTLLDPNW